MTPYNTLPVRDLPARERPVNRLREVGPTAVSCTELLACLLQTPDALGQAKVLLARFGGLAGLAAVSEATTKSQEAAAQRLGGLTGGLKIPGLT